MGYKSRKNHTKKNCKYCNSKKHRKSRKNKRCRHVGGCGCDRLFGGSTNLQALPATYYYKYNSDLASDPTSPNNMVDARLAGDFSRMNGGGKKSSKNRKMKLRRGKMRGGSSFFTNMFGQIENSGSGHNFLTSLGAANGSSVQNALISGTGGIVNSSVTSQPVSVQPFGSSNIPLV